MVLHNFQNIYHIHHKQFHNNKMAGSETSSSSIIDTIINSQNFRDSLSRAFDASHNTNAASFNNVESEVSSIFRPRGAAAVNRQEVDSQWNTQMTRCSQSTTSQSLNTFTPALPGVQPTNTYPIFDVRRNYTSSTSRRYRQLKF